MGEGAVAAWQHGRERVRLFVDRHRVAWEIFMAALTAVYVILSFLEDSSDPSWNLLTAGLVSLGAIFLGEFALRCWASKDRLEYTRRHWLDVVTCLPLVGPLRGLRFLRLLRFIRLGVAVRRLVMRDHRGRNEDFTWLIWPFLLLFWVGSAYALFIYENGVNPMVKTFSGALYLSFLTASTVGYGDVQPVTFGGKIVGGVVVFVAIGLIGFTSARLTTMWLGQAQDDSPARLAHIERELSDMRRLLEAALGPKTSAEPVAEASGE